MARAAERQLDDVRKAAESWRNGLAGLLALITTVSVVKGRSTLAEIRPDWQICVAVITLLSSSPA